MPHLHIQIPIACQRALNTHEHTMTSYKDLLVCSVCYLCSTSKLRFGGGRWLHQRAGAPGSQATRRHVSCHGRVGTKMNLGSVETFSGLDDMLVTVMVKYERRCVTDEGCSLILLHAGPLPSSLHPSNAQ